MKSTCWSRAVRSALAGLVLTAACLSLVPACSRTSLMQDATLKALPSNAPVREGSRTFAFTSKGKPFALLSYSVRRLPDRIAVDRSYRALLPGGAKCLAAFHTEFAPDDLGLLSYESRMTEPVNSTVSVGRDGDKTVFSWNQQDGAASYSAVLPPRLLPLDSNYLGAEGLEFAGRLIYWGSQGEQSLLMLDPACASSSLTRPFLVTEASVTVVGQQEISVSSKRYVAAVADIAMPQVRFRCWYDSATLDLLRWEVGTTGFAAARVDGDDVVLVAPDQQAFTDAMANPVIVPINLDVTRYWNAKGFSVQVDLWVVAAESDLEAAIESAGQDFEGQVTREKGCWHVVGTFTITPVSNGPWPNAYGTGDGSPLLTLRGDAPAQYTLSEGSIEADDPFIRAKAVEIIGGEARLQTSTRWDAIEKVAYWVANNVKYQITQVRSAKATLESLVGDCGPHSMLTAAMLRSVGVPCRLVSGMCLLGKRAGQHVWVQVFMGDRIGWIAVDPTLGEVGELRPLRFMPWGLEGALAPAAGPAEVRVEVLR